MLCQNCKRNDAGVHLKRIVGGESAEIHLCSVCAAALGVRDAVTGFSPFGDMLGNLSGAGNMRSANRVLRCETCGFSFEDIARTGLPGCPDCYRVFTVKLRPTIGKIHGRAVFKGKTPEKYDTPKVNGSEIAVLREQLQKAVEAEDYETAALLRDRIRQLQKGEDNV